MWLSEFAQSTCVQRRAASASLFFSGTARRHFCSSRMHVVCRASKDHFWHPPARRSLGAGVASRAHTRLALRDVNFFTRFALYIVCHYPERERCGDKERALRSNIWPTDCVNVLPPLMHRGGYKKIFITQSLSVLGSKEADSANWIISLCSRWEKNDKHRMGVRRQSNVLI